ncbi:MAG: GAP family protein, partial [Pseudoxanthomonas sp.]
RHPRCQPRMESLLSSLLLLALLDSLNPSALVVALWLLSRPKPAARLLAYVAGILASYLALGITMMLGFTALSERLGQALDHPVALAMQGLLGAALLVYAIFAPSSAHAAQEPDLPATGKLLGFFVLGMAVTAAELVTALPYFAAIALMIGDNLEAAQWLPLLLGYNLIFIVPPLLLLGLHALLGHRTDERFARWRERLRRGAREATLWIFALVGVALMGDAASRWPHAGQSAEKGLQGTEAVEQKRDQVPSQRRPISWAEQSDTPRQDASGSGETTMDRKEPRFDKADLSGVHQRERRQSSHATAVVP